MKRFLWLPSLILASSLSAQESPAERILFPVLSKPFAGNLGSLWRTELTMLIDSESEVSIFPLVDCVRCEDSLPRSEPFAPPFFFQQPGHPPGSIIYVTPETARALHFSLHVRDASRTDSGAGTEIPVVREKDFFTATLHLPDVPLDGGFRQTLRIYDVGARPGAAIRLRIVSSGDAVPALDRVIAFAFSPAHNPSFTNSPTPGYIQLDLSSRPELAGLGRVRVEIEPLTPELEFWAFVTLTNNVTQQVTVISPQ